MAASTLTPTLQLISPLTAYYSPRDHPSADTPPQAHVVHPFPPNLQGHREAEMRLCEAGLDETRSLPALAWLVRSVPAGTDVREAICDEGESARLFMFQMREVGGEGVLMRMEGEALLVLGFGRVAAR